MSDDEDDYLSDKFLAQLEQPKAAPKSYHELRREAAKKSAMKNEAGRKKSIKQLEEEARQEGLQKSLFERAKEEEEEFGVGSKALGMMKKMGFKVGESLGRQPSSVADTGPRDSAATSNGVETRGSPSHSPSPAPLDGAPSAFAHRKTPLPLNLWSGKSVDI